MRRTVLLPAFLLLALLGAAPAHAAFVRVVRVDQGGASPGARNFANFAAAPGEANRLVTWSSAGKGSDIVLHFADGGAPIAPGSGCTAVTRSEVSCTAELGAFGRIRLGDGNDRWKMVPGVPVPQGAEALGGSGDDVLRSGNGPSTLDGGPGTDAVHGGSNVDVLKDSDASGDLRPDVLDGGGGNG